jgi:hypothetical protein
LSRFLIVTVQALCLVGALILVAVPLWFWTSPERVAQLGPQLAGVHEMSIDGRTLQLGALVSVVPIGLGLYTLWQLWGLFGLYARGRVFSAGALTRLRRFAWALFATALIAPMVRAAMSVVLTFGNPPGRRALVVGLSWNDYMTVLLAVVLIAIATVMAQAVRLAEENEGFV